MRLTSAAAVGVIIDIQERLFPHIHDHDTVAANTIKLIGGLQILDIPLILTEQYPSGLGPTIAPVRTAMPGVEAIEKITFSCCDHPPFLEKLRQSERPQLIICGIETHVCVLQTVIDAVTLGYQPVVIADAVSSRRESDKVIALERIRQEGGIVSSVESLLFELCRRAGNDTFRQISRLVK